MKGFQFRFVLLGLVLSACSQQNFSLPDQTRDFAQGVKYNNKVDVVMMVDNSTSMSIYQQRLADQIPSMIQALNALGMDYHVAIVTTDIRPGGNGGKFIGTPKYLVSTSGTLVNDLTHRVVAGQDGSTLEQGLLSVQRALSPSYLSTEGAGFLRDDAMLALIFLSNEDDYSPNTVQSYVDFLDQVKKPFASGARSWVANFIGVLDMEGDCKSSAEQDYKEPGLRYMSLVGLSQGVQESICQNNFAKALENVRVRVSQLMTDFYLDRKPKIDTIKVYVNGREVAKDSVNGWSYDPVKNLIRFNGTAVPNANDVIKVDFSPEGAT
ncbi:MAG: hypothetical protein BroJett040_16460 [Oligoflexia bacterium]|nr:MAG: hypothetical protein BroJett040_16460 [Oligoflexia bacterium]